MIWAKLMAKSTTVKMGQAGPQKLEKFVGLEHNNLGSLKTGPF